MSLATASCDLWQKEQRRTSSLPVLVLTVTDSFALHAPSQDSTFPIRVFRPREPGRSRAAPVRTTIVLDVAIGALAIASLYAFIEAQLQGQCVRAPRIQIQLLNHIGNSFAQPSCETWTARKLQLTYACK